MRELKFRVQAIDKQDDKYWIFIDLKKSSRNPLVTGKVHGNLLDLKTVGQFTGLLDKNGVEIYEGDVIKGGVRTMKVIYNQSFCQYWLVWENKEKRLCFEPLKSSYKSNNFTDDDLEIIGNIYENKEYKYLLTL